MRVAILQNGQKKPIPRSWSKLNGLMEWNEITSISIHFKHDAEKKRIKGDAISENTEYNEGNPQHRF